tara:strand:- start:1347 stop:1478 length:132 start_codon:yes stop_codon:yes gene_type:complete
LTEAAIMLCLVIIGVLTNSLAMRKKHPNKSISSEDGSWDKLQQ